MVKKGTCKGDESGFVDQRATHKYHAQLLHSNVPRIPVPARHCGKMFVKVPLRRLEREALFRTESEDLRRRDQMLRCLMLHRKGSAVSSLLVAVRGRCVGGLNSVELAGGEALELRLQGRMGTFAWRKSQGTITGGGRRR